MSEYCAELFNEEEEHLQQTHRWYRTVLTIKNTSYGATASTTKHYYKTFYDAVLQFMCPCCCNECELTNGKGIATHMCDSDYWGGRISRMMEVASIIGLQALYEEAWSEELKEWEAKHPSTTTEETPSTTDKELLNMVESMYSTIKSFQEFVEKVKKVQ